MQLQRPPTRQQSSQDFVAQAVEAVRLVVGGAALAPLTDPEFVAGLSERTVRILYDRAGELRPSARDDTIRRTIDLVLWNATDRLGLEKERKEIEGRLSNGGPFRREDVVQQF